MRAGTAEIQVLQRAAVIALAQLRTGFASAAWKSDGRIAVSYRYQLRVRRNTQALRAPH